MAIDVTVISKPDKPMNITYFCLYVPTDTHLTPAILKLVISIEVYCKAVRNVIVPEKPKKDPHGNLKIRTNIVKKTLNEVGNEYKYSYLEFGLMRVIKTAVSKLVKKLFTLLIDLQIGYSTLVAKPC